MNLVEMKTEDRGGKDWDAMGKARETVNSVSRPLNPTSPLKAGVLKGWDKIAVAVRVTPGPEEARATGNSCVRAPRRAERFKVRVLTNKDNTVVAGRASDAWHGEKEPWITVGDKAGARWKTFVPNADALSETTIRD
jgi:hypothetical protein